MKEKLSEKVIQRLTLYHNILSEFEFKNIYVISSPQIAHLLKIDDSQVRKDVKLLNHYGKRRVGYIVKELKNAIEKTLGFSTVKDAFIVGAGNLGLALSKYDNFSNYGFNILAMFDNDPLKINLISNNKEVFHISKLPDLAKRLNVEIAILTVPRYSAQIVTNILVESQIKYIWNFAPCILDVPSDVEVWNENLIGNFLQFTVSHQHANKVLDSKEGTICQ